MEAVEEVAQGRVWSGREALARKMVDALGGLRVAVDKAKEKLGLGYVNIVLARKRTT